MTQQNNFSNEKEHYQSLTSLFKYSVTLVSSLIVIIGGIAGYVTYNNGKEMRDDLKDEKKELQNSVNEMKSDLKAQKEELSLKEDMLNKKVLELMAVTRDDINNTKQAAVGQIAGIKDIATTEARGRIDQVFKDKNFDQFVEKVAQERMEPRIQKIVDLKIDNMENAKVDRINLEIGNLSSTDRNKFRSACAYLQNNLDKKFSDEQIQKIIIVVRNLTDAESVLAIHNILILQKSNIIERFFKDELLKGITSVSDVSNIEMTYLMSSELEQDLSFYFEVLKKSPRPEEILQNMFLNSFTVNKEFFPHLLNSKYIVDSMYASFGKEQIERCKVSIWSYFSKEQIKSFYFFTKTN